MQYKALISFSGLISMSMGEVREIADQKIVNDLLKAEYILPVKDGSEPVARGSAGTKKEEIKKTRKGGKKKK